MTRARIALAGAGLIGRRHAEAIAASGTARLAAVIDPAAAGADLAARAGVPHFADLDAMPAGLADGVILATPNQAHRDGALACIARGLPVLVEKPVATTLADAQAIVAAGEAAGVAVLVGHHRRHNPLIAEAKRMIDAGAIGRPVAAHGMFWLVKPPEYFAPDWRRAPGAGPVFLNLIHDIDLLRHFLGEVGFVQAVQSHAIRGNPVEDAAALILTFASGVIATMSVADCIPAPWSWELTAGENPAYSPTGQACCMIGGTEGALELPALRLWRHSPRQSWWEPIAASIAPRPQGEPLLAQIEHFARVIAGTEAPLVSGREGLRTLAVTLAVKTAAETGARVAVPA